MDDLDQRIIRLLQSDGRASNASIARKVGVSEGTVRRRLRYLIEGEFIKVIAVPNLTHMGYATAALVGVQTEPGKVDDVADSIATLEEAQYVAVTTGAYDIFTWVSLESPDKLVTLLASKVGSIPGVRRTETFVNLSIKKRTYGLVL